MSKLCPKDVRNFETYLKESNSTEMLEPLKADLFRIIFIFFFTLRFFAASYTREKSEVQVLYRPFLSSVKDAVLRLGVPLEMALQSSASAGPDALRCQR